MIRNMSIPDQIRETREGTTDQPQPAKQTVCVGFSCKALYRPFNGHTDREASEWRVVQRYGSHGAVTLVPNPLSSVNEMRSTNYEQLSCGVYGVLVHRKQRQHARGSMISDGRLCSASYNHGSITRPAVCGFGFWSLGGVMPDLKRR